LRRGKQGHGKSLIFRQMKKQREPKRDQRTGTQHVGGKRTTGQEDDEGGRDRKGLNIRKKHPLEVEPRFRARKGPVKRNRGRP